MEISQSLKTAMKRLKLGGLLPTLPERVAYARKTKLTELDFLELALHDEIARRDEKNLAGRLARAGFQEEQTFEGFDWDAPVTFDRDRVRDLFTLGFVERQEDVIFLGPVGVGKTFLASALGHAACRAGYDVLFLRADHMLQALHQARADHSSEKVLRRLLAPDVLILDDFGLRRLDARQSSDFYRSYSSATAVPRRSSRATAPSTSGSRSSMIRSSPRAPSTASPTTPTRSRSKATATASASGPATRRPPLRPAPRSPEGGPVVAPEPPPRPPCYATTRPRDPGSCS
jgi:DNA replication protein DnaC